MRCSKEDIPSKFTYPFCYCPHPAVVAAARELMDSIDPALFSEGKMLGVLLTDKGPLYAFSGLSGGRSTLEGFVPPILDLTAPDGYFKKREAEISAMPQGPEKSRASAELQDWIFSNCKVLNALGEEKSVKDIFALRGIVPPGGTGECAAPKLLNFAFRNGYRPLAMGEFWYGASPASEVREHGRFYPSCTGKCGPLLTWMMQGLDVEDNPLDTPYSRLRKPSVLYEDDAVIVVDKPSGMLSVPGRTRMESLLTWLRDRYGEDVQSCHRLDMDTSGVMVFARGVAAKTALELQFAASEVRKTYRARLVGGPWNHARKGTIALPLSPDWYDRPRQMVDTENGKRAITGYEVLDILPNGEIDIRFTPLTGRTHQLRVHAAHIRGLGHPIKGDRLYGSPEKGGLLYLRAESICFRHPVSGELKSFLCDEVFGNLNGVESSALLDLVSGKP